MNDFTRLLEVQAEHVKKKNKTLLTTLLVFVIVEVVLVGLAMMLSEDDLSSFAIIMVIVFGVLALIFLAVIAGNNKKKNKIDDSIKNASDKIKARLMEDCKTGYRFANVIVCRDGLLYLNANATFLSFDEIVIMYPHSVRQTVLLIPIVSINQIVIWDINQKDRGIMMGVTPFAMSGKLKKEDTIRFYDEVNKNAPWILIGASQENMQLMNDFKKLVKVVQDRQIEWIIQNEK